MRERYRISAFCRGDRYREPGRWQSSLWGAPVGPEGDVLLSSGNTYARDRGVGHAESNVARAAAQQLRDAPGRRNTAQT